MRRSRTVPPGCGLTPVLDMVRTRLGRSGTVRRLVTEGNAANAGRDWGRAERCYTEALAMRPGLARVRVQLGHALKEQGSLRPAEQAYRQALDRQRVDG